MEEQCAPGIELRTWLVAIEKDARSPDALEKMLRGLTPPVIARGQVRSGRRRSASSAVRVMGVSPRLATIALAMARARRSSP